MFHFPRKAADVDAIEEVAASQRETAAVLALRRHVRRHNWQALTLAFFSFVASAVLWGAAYLFLYWLCLISVTIKRSFDVETLSEINDPRLIAAWFPWWFLAGALLLLLMAKLVGRKLRSEELRNAGQYFLWVIVELLAAVPDVTFAIWGNLAALVRLRRAEALQAWQLLERMHHDGDRLSASGLRLLIEDEQQLEHTVFVLQIVGLVELREKSEGWFLCLQDRDAYATLSRAGGG